MEDEINRKVRQQGTFLAKQGVSPCLKKINMDGVIIINKPKGITSNAVVQKVRKILNTEQVGHCGTLDPLAIGVLPILIGKGTKISKYLVEHNKTYIATIKLGKKTETADSEGKVIETKEVQNLDENKVSEILHSFMGKQMQIPPIYSAIKKDGKKLYEYARANEEVEIKPREIEIYEIKLLKYNREENLIMYEVTCSKGTYIRTLCEDIAKRLETVGYMKDLTRTKVDRFSLENAVSMEELELMKENTQYISIEELYSSNQSINLDDKKLELFLNGVMLSFTKEDGVYRIYNQNRFIGLGTLENSLLKRDVVI